MTCRRSSLSCAKRHRTRPLPPVADFKPEISNVRTVRAVQAVLGCALFLLRPALAAEDEFKFMPKGGSEMFLDVLSQCANCDAIAELVTSQRTEEGWLKYFAGKQRAQKYSGGDKKTGALAGLPEKQGKTLASYLAANAPMAKSSLPKDSKKADWKSVLPPDGRQLALEKCMGCHGIAVTMLNEADLRGWDMILRKSDHRGLKLTDREAQTLKSYLAINAPLPESEIPAALKQSSAAY